MKTKSKKKDDGGYKKFMKKVLAKSKNLETLMNFEAYCFEHPSLRFWQSLASWKKSNIFLSPDKVTDQCINLEDTYYLKGK